MLTAVDEEDTVVRGLQFHAEDYVLKPFSPRQLVARVERVLRRVQDFGYTTHPRIVLDERLSVSLAAQSATVDGVVVHLTPTETKLLYILVLNAGRVVTTGFLLQRLWPLGEAYEEGLRVHVRRLRRKLEADPAHPKLIVTERGEGYRFVVP
jgi:DNA-binding response OmpR family regulator